MKAESKRNPPRYRWLGLPNLDYQKDAIPSFYFHEKSLPFSWNSFPNTSHVPLAGVRGTASSEEASVVCNYRHPLKAVQMFV